MKSHAILLFTCPDQQGIVATITALLATHNGNIVTLDQYSNESKKFFMRLEWELDAFNLTTESLHAELEIITAQFKGTYQLFYTAKSQRMALFVSKYDHCLFDLLLRKKSGEISAEIPLIISNHADLYSVADIFHIPFHHFDITDENKIAQEKKQLALLKEHDIDFVVLARYMQVLSPRFIVEYPYKIINVHHSFLPAFSGAKPYEQAYQRGVKIIGATSHLVTDKLDEGPIIEQEVIPITHKETVDDLMTMGRDLERKVLAKAVRLYLEHRLLIDNQRTIIF